jgi:signal peptidase I
VNRAPKPPFENSLEGPRLSVERIYRHGVLELIWPRPETESDADSILHAGMWVSLAYASIGWLNCANEHRTISGAIVFAFLTVAALGIRAGSLTAILSIFAFLAFASFACVVSFGLSVAPIALVVAPLLLLGSVRATRFLAVRQTPVAAGARLSVLVKKCWTRLWPLPGILLGLLGFSASITVLFGTALALYPMGVDGSMEPTLHTGDWIVSVNKPLMGAIHRGDLVPFPYWRPFGTERVVGLPGDRIQVEFGKLIRNGKEVAEPYRKQPYRGGLGDFPLPPEAFPDGVLRWEQRYAYPDSLKLGEAFVVPKDTYFLLNDDRNQLMDSRIFGPLSESNIAGRPILAYSARTGRWSLPRLIY